MEAGRWKWRKKEEIVIVKASCGKEKNTNRNKRPVESAYGEEGKVTQERLNGLTKPKPLRSH